MHIGFYAPLKSPNHEVPSGDRAMARLLTKVLENSGYDVELLSELRSWDGTGSNEAQIKIRLQADKEILRLKQYYSSQAPPDLIFTYHLYHKAPDWIGVELADHFKIPYIITEASYAPKQADGIWDMGHQQTLKCIKASQTIICLNPNDIECIKSLLNKSQKLEYLKPFLGNTPKIPKDKKQLRNDFAKTHKLDGSKVWLITVAMMREGDKLQSYQQLAKTISRLSVTNWQLIIIGDGRAGDKIKNLFSSVADHCLFLGELDHGFIYNWLSVSDVFVWPAINEAFGLALLEAQAYGLPVIAQDFGGVSSIVENEKTGYVTNPKLKNEFTAAIKNLIEHKMLRATMSQAARKKFLQQHSFEFASRQINQIIEQAIADQ